MNHGTAARPGFWQRRYLLRYYRRFDDATLARAAGLPTTTVDAFLHRLGALRSPKDLRRIAQSEEEPPAMFSPEAARKRLARLRSRPLTPLDWWLLAAMLLGSLALYGATAARTVTGEDGGELLAAAHVFGVPHPPGYPLWLLLAWAADHALPFGSVAFRVSMASFVFSAIANACLLALALKTIRSRLAATVGAALFAVSLTHWTQAVIPEVYGLNIFFFALCVLLFVRLVERPTPGRLVALAFTAGLACTNHTTAVPAALVLLGMSILAAPALFKRPGLVGLVLLAGLLPNTLYLLLPLVSARDPYVDWGNPETLSSLWEHMTRRQYSGMETEHRAEASYGEYLLRLDNLWHWALRQFGSGWVLLLPALGFLPLSYRQTGLWLVLTVSAYLCTIGVTRYMAYDLGREHTYAVTMFWIPPAMALAWYAAEALNLVLSGVHWVAGRLRPVAGQLVRTTATASLAGLVLLPVTRNYGIADRSETRAIENFSRALLDVMEPNALYFPSSDHSTFGVLYWQGVEGYRLDVTLPDKYGRIDPAIVEQYLTDEDWQQLDALPGQAHRAHIEARLIERWPGPVYFANRRDMADVPGRTLEPVGPLFRVMTEVEAAAWWKPGDDGSQPRGLAIWNGLDRLVNVPADERLDLTVQMVWCDALYMKGFAHLRADDLDAALLSWSSMEADLAPLKQAFNNCGSALAEHGRTEEALGFYRRALEEDSRYVLALRNTVIVHRNRHEWDRAIMALRAVLDVDPSRREDRFELARLLDQEDRPSEALAEYEALAKADPRDPLPWAEGGKLLHARGDRSKAEEAYVEALRLDPHNEDVAESLSRLRQGVDLLAQQMGPALDGEHAEDELMPRTTVPGLPADPAQALMFDPMGGLQVPPDTRPGQ